MNKTAVDNTDKIRYNNKVSFLGDGDMNRTEREVISGRMSLTADNPYRRASKFVLTEAAGFAAAMPFFISFFRSGSVMGKRIRSILKHDPGGTYYENETKKEFRRTACRLQARDVIYAVPE